MADPNMRTPEQILYDHEYNEMLRQSTWLHPHYNARAHRRWVSRRLGERPGGGLGANEHPEKRPG